MNKIIKFFKQFEKTLLVLTAVSIIGLVISMIFSQSDQLVIVLMIFFINLILAYYTYDKSKAAPYFLVATLIVIELIIIINKIIF